MGILSLYKRLEEKINTEKAKLKQRKNNVNNILRMLAFRQNR